MSAISRELILTKHAAHMCRERRIATEWIGRALRQPLWTEPDRRDRRLRHALLPIVERGDRILRVVYDPSAKPWRVVTVFFDRQARRPS